MTLKLPENPTATTQCTIEVDFNSRDLIGVIIDIPHFRSLVHQIIDREVSSLRPSSSSTFLSHRNHEDELTITLEIIPKRTYPTE